MRLPGWIAAVAASPRMRRDWRERLGLDVPPVPPGVVWVHGASMGELGAAEALLPHLPRPVLLTADTDTGADRARKLANAVDVIAGVMPADHPWLLAPLWAEARPRALILVEGTWWTALVEMARESGVPVLRVSAKAGPRTRWVPRPLIRRWTRSCSAVVARDEHEAAWFRATHTCPVHVGGDLKGDRPRPDPLLRWSRPFVVAASTRPGDEARVLAALPEGFGLVLAPRHPERFEDVASWLDTTELRWNRRTELGTSLPDDLDVYLLDTVGELAAALVGARAAVIGGTWDPAIGGHSPQEARIAGVPVVFGPEISANPGAFADLGDPTTNLEVDLARAVDAPPPPPLSAGAAHRTAELIRPWLAGPPAPESSPRPWARVAAPWLRWAERLRRREPIRLSVPVVAVGSRNARGGGKTSATRWIAAELARRGHQVGVWVRGYRRDRRDLAVGDTSAVALGDEGALLASDGHLVAAGPDRVRAAQELVDAGATVVVLEDGLSPRGLFVDVAIEVVDARYPNARGPLPAGERRPAMVEAPVEGVLRTHGPGPGVTARHIPGPWFFGDAPKPAGPDGQVTVVCGIARPHDFLETLEVEVGRVEVLPDHGPIDPDWLAALPRPVLMTAKDRVRVPDAEVWWRDVRLEVDAPPDDWFPRRPDAPPRR